MKKASYFEEINENNVKCVLCPHNCVIKPNTLGICKVRKNIDEILYSLVPEDNYYQIRCIPLIQQRPLNGYVTIV